MCALQSIKSLQGFINDLHRLLYSAEDMREQDIWFDNQILSGNNAPGRICSYFLTFLFLRNCLSFWADFIDDQGFL